MFIESTDTLSASFDELNEVLRGVNLPVSSAEAQGHYCGLVCGGLPHAESLWLDEMLPLWKEVKRTTLIRVCDLTRQSLRDSEAGFVLWLPGDEYPIRQRVAALGHWCQGFLYGWGVAGSLAGRQATAREIVADLVEISRVDSDRIEASEEAEVSYAELVEYLRVAVMTLSQELTQEGSQQNLGTNLHNPVGR